MLALAELAALPILREWLALLASESLSAGDFAASSLAAAAFGEGAEAFCVGRCLEALAPDDRKALIDDVIMTLSNVSMRYPKRGGQYLIASMRAAIDPRAPLDCERAMHKPRPRHSFCPRLGVLAINLYEQG